MAHVVTIVAAADFAPGWNGEARTPPLGWRSWNVRAANQTTCVLHDAHC